MRRHTQTSSCLKHTSPPVTKSQIVEALVCVTCSLFSVSYQRNRGKAGVTHSFTPSQLYKADYFPVFFFSFKRSVSKDIPPPRVMVRRNWVPEDDPQRSCISDSSWNVLFRRIIFLTEDIPLCSNKFV